jgi:hypothetical protein
MFEYLADPINTKAYQPNRFKQIICHVHFTLKGQSSEILI